MNNLDKSLVSITENKTSKKSLVLLHGWAMHSAIWGDFAQQLSQHYNVTKIDLPPLETLNAISDEVVAQLPAKKFYLLGWSFGGTVALDIAVRHKNRVQGVILIAANPCFVACENWAGMPQDTFENFALQFHENPNTTLQRFLALQIQGAPKFLKEVKNRFAEKEIASFTDLEISLALLKNSDLRAEFKNLICPTLVILSDNDALIPIAVSVQLQTLKPDLSLRILNGATHIPFVSQTQTCLTITHAFLNGSR